MNVRILPANLQGEVFAPPSKSVAHRALICAALANESSTVFPVDWSKDMEATIGALKTLGASIVRNDKEVTITGIGKAPKQAKVDCIEFQLPQQKEFPVSLSAPVAYRNVPWPLTLMHLSEKAHALIGSLSLYAYPDNCNPVYLSCPVISVLNLSPGFYSRFLFFLRTAPLLSPLRLNPLLTLI